MNFFLIIIFPLFTASVISLYFLPLLIKVAYKLSIVDKPDNILKKHEFATPYLGGLGIYLGLIASLSAWLPFKNNMLILILGVTILLVVGLIDDIVQMSPSSKFIGQFLVVLCLLKSGIFLKEQFFHNILNILLSFVWLLSIINAFNLVDVMDGLCAIIAISNIIIFLVLGILFGKINIIILLAAFLGALLSFFIFFNKPAAKMYLGDSGSMFIGGLLGSMPFFFSWSEFNSLGFFAPILIFAIPILELLSLILIRLYKGISPFKGSRDHFSLYLYDKGWTKNQILVFSFTTSILWGLLAILFVFNFSSIGFISLFSAIFFVVWAFCVLDKNMLHFVLNFKKVTK